MIKGNRQIADITITSICNENGVTLVEILVYMVIAGMILGTAVMTFIGQNQTYNRQDIIAEIQQNIRAATELMVSEIRMAGYDPEGKGARFLSANENSLSFEYWKDEDDDGDYDDESIRKITFDLYDAYSDGSLDIGRTVGGLKRPLAENIKYLRFEYLYLNSATGQWKWANNITAIKNDLGISEDKSFEQIKAVKIIILANARPSAFSKSDTITYKPPLEGSGAGTVWSPSAGTGITRIVSVIVQCRNNKG